MQNPHDIIIKPVLTEKSYDHLADKVYTFIVDKKASKTEIRQAVEQVFGVKVESVNTVNVRGKLKRQGRSEGYTSKSKKAVVKLTSDSKAIEFFESLA